MARKIEVFYRAIDSLTAYKRNARTHSPEQIRQLVAAINEFGFTSPVLIDEDGGVIAGHGRIEAARIAGLVEVPTIEVGGLTETQRRALILADNKIAINAGWDETLLALELNDLTGLGFNLGLAGFDAAELAKLIGPATPLDTSPQLTDGFKFSVIVGAENEADQGLLIERFEAEGLTCRPLITQ